MEVKRDPGSLIVAPHPLTFDGARTVPCDLLPGESLLHFLRRHLDNADSGAWVVTLGGFEVPQKLWAITRPKPGAIIEARCIVREDVVRIGAIIALAYFAPGIGAALAGSGATAGAIAGYTAGVMMAGSVLINTVLAPKTAAASDLRDMQASPTYKLSGGRNRARPYEPIPILFGELQVTPDFASLPYTVFEGDDQFLYSVFHAGINCARVSSIVIGQTPIESYDDVVIRTSGISGMDDQPLLGYGNVDSVDGAQLVCSAAPGDWVTRTSSADTITLQADFEGQLFAVRSDGGIEERGITLYGEYRLLPDGPWQVFVNTNLTHASTKPLRATFSVAVAQGQYEVRFRKDTPDEQSATVTNILSWLQLKSIQPDTGTYGGMGRLGMKIRASGQLNGALDEVRWIATAKPMPYWDGEEWTTASTRENGLSNPGAQILKFARGIYDDDDRLIAGLGLDDEQIDIESLQGFMERCAAKGFTFDYWLDSTMSCQEILDAIAGVGLGAIAWPNGKLGVVWAAEDQPIEGVVNMATMKQGTFQVEYQTADTADGIEYSYYDRDRGFAWKTIRVAEPDVTTPLNPARVSSMGVTKDEHAAVLARFHLAQSLFQRKTVSYGADLEHLTYRRMSVLALTHDVTQWGYGGRLRAAVNDDGYLTLTLDNPVPAGASSRYIGLRIPGEVGYRVFGVDGFTGTAEQVTLTDPWPEGVPVPGGAGNPAMDTIWVYDFKSTPGYKVRVTNIDPAAGLSGASVSVVPESDEFWDYVWNGEYTPPASQSLLQILPTISGLQITEELQRQGNSFYVELTATFQADGLYGRSEVWGATAGNALQKLGETTGLRFPWRGTLNDVWTVEVRPFDRLGRAGTPQGTEYEVQGLAVPPSDMTGFAVVYDRNIGPTLVWNKNPEVDIEQYEIRDGAVWESATNPRLVKGNSLKVAAVSGVSKTYSAKALDTSGNYSENAATVTVTVTAPPAPSLTAVIEGSELVLTCSEVAGTLATAAYDVRYGASFAAGTSLGPLKGTTRRIPISWAGTRQFWAAAIDIAGNVGAAGNATVGITVPSAPVISQQVIDNNVLLRWSDAKKTLPIQDYEMRKGDVFESAEVIGRINARFSVVFESLAGTYKYWVVGIDTAGNYGTPGSTTGSVAQPPDYQLQANIVSDFSGTKSNLAQDVDGSWYGPVDTAETWAEHFSARGWDTIQDQIDAGYPRYAEPGVSSAHYEEEIDYGTVLPATRISVTPNYTIDDGSPTISITVSVKKEAGDSWTDYVGVNSVYVTDFRYLKVRLNISGGGTSILRFPADSPLIVRLDVKRITDGGMGAADASDVDGTEVTFNTAFIDVQALTVTPQGSNAAYATYDFVDVPYPSVFKVYLWDKDGNRVSGPFSWNAKGV